MLGTLSGECAEYYPSQGGAGQLLARRGQSTAGCSGLYEIAYRRERVGLAVEIIEKLNGKKVTGASHAAILIFATIGVVLLPVATYLAQQTVEKIDKMAVAVATQAATSKAQDQSIARLQISTDEAWREINNFGQRLARLEGAGGMSQRPSLQ